MAGTINKNDESKIYAFIGVFLTLIGFLIVYFTRKEDQYALFYAKQGLIIFIFAIATSILRPILSWMPFVGWLISATLGLCIFIFWIIGIVYSFSGEQKLIPIIGPIANKFKL